MFRKISSFIPKPGGGFGWSGWWGQRQGFPAYLRVILLKPASGKKRDDGPWNITKWVQTMCTHVLKGIVSIITPFGSNFPSSFDDTSYDRVAPGYLIGVYE